MAENNYQLTPEQKKRQRQRSIAIALALGAFVFIVWGVTMVKIGGNLAITHNAGFKG